MADTTELAEALALLDLDPHITQLATKLQEEPEDFKKCLSTLEAMNRGLKDELGAPKRKVEDQATKIEERQQVNIDHAEEIDSLMSYNHELKAENTDFREEHKDLSKETKDCGVGMDCLKHGVDFFEKRDNDNTKKLKKYAMEMEDLKSKVKFLEYENKSHIQRYINSKESSEASQARAQAEAEDVEMKEVVDETSRPVCQLYLARNCRLGSHPPRGTDPNAQELQLQLAK